MNVLVTGAKGFLGKHTVKYLKEHGHNVFEYDIDSTYDELDEDIKNADFVIHLAGINRPLSNEEFYDGNANFTKLLVDRIKEAKRFDLPVLMSSSIQAALDNDYGRSKKMGEDFLFESGLPVYIYRLNNIFGKWCKPNYNSVTATFCYNISHDIPISISSRKTIIEFNYVDDIVLTFYQCVLGYLKPSSGILNVSPKYACSLGKLSDLLYYFKDEIMSERHLPIIHNDFEFKLFKTFCNYFSDENSSFNHVSDENGSFEEIFKSEKYGQISVNISKPGITKGNHYHTYKKEIFSVITGKCEIKQQNVDTKETIVNVENGSNPTLVEIKPNYTHTIKNVGKDISITLMWISEIYNPDKADTIKKEVE